MIRRGPLLAAPIAAVIFAASPVMAAEPVERIATGAFDVKAAPEGAADAPIGTYKLDKVYHGDLDGIGTGKMLTVDTKTEGSAAYVAIERVTGTLAGRKGGFALDHVGTMARGATNLHIAIVPDSGTDALTGITGTLDIRIEKDGKHFYTLRYKLPN
jgi:hypothetical protein